jgi:3-oxoacyl-[acyl-carrier protein] reductase
MPEENNRVALVTGAGNEGGLGAALAIDLAAQGFAAMVHFRTSEDGAERTVAAIRGNGGRAEMTSADLSKEAGAIELASAVEEHFGRLDVLVNNAGVYTAEPMMDLSEEDWHLGFGSTASAVFFTTRACLPLLRKATKGGRVINLGDGSCDCPGARDLAMSYHIGKTGVWMLTRSFAKSEAKHGVAVNMVSPGLLENSVGLEGNAAADDVPAGRYGSFGDVSEAVRFFANAQSTYLTGSNLSVGGGWNL